MMVDRRSPSQFFGEDQDDKRFYAFIFGCVVVVCFLAFLVSRRRG